MIVLKPAPFETLQRFFVDFQKKSQCFVPPSDTAECIGIYKNTVLIGYFIVQGYEGVEVEIEHGYLLPEYRHFDLSKECTLTLEKQCKASGYKKILLGTHNRFRSYLKFAKYLGYTPTYLSFSKEL